jgi:hypothetical protein
MADDELEGGVLVIGRQRDRPRRAVVGHSPAVHNEKNEKGAK